MRQICIYLNEEQSATVEQFRKNWNAKNVPQIVFNDAAALIMIRACAWEKIILDASFDEVGNERKK